MSPRHLKLAGISNKLENLSRRNDFFLSRSIEKHHLQTNYFRLFYLSCHSRSFATSFFSSAFFDKPKTENLFFVLKIGTSWLSSEYENNYFPHAVFFTLQQKLGEIAL
jgi:hypothetical protein